MSRGDYDADNLTAQRIAMYRGAVASAIRGIARSGDADEGEPMKALSVRQPWAWAIMNAGKNIENRCWRTSFRGRFLLHAAKGMTRDEYEDAAFTINLICRDQGIETPPREQLERGGFIGTAEVVSCVSAAPDGNKWFFGPYGFVLSDPKPMPFVPWRGELGFFHVDETLWSESRGGAT